MAIAPLWLRAAVWPEFGTAAATYDHLVLPLYRSPPTGVTKQLLSWSCERGVRSADPEVVWVSRHLAVQTEANPKLAADVALKHMNAMQVKFECEKYLLRHAASVPELRTLLKKIPAPSPDTLADTMVRLSEADLVGVLDLFDLQASMGSANVVDEAMMTALRRVVGDDPRKVDMLVDRMLLAPEPSRYIYSPGGLSAFSDHRAIMARALVRTKDQKRRESLAVWIVNADQLDRRDTNQTAAADSTSIESDSWIGPFVEAITDSNKTLRSAVVHSLSAVRDERIEGALLSRAADDPGVRRTVLQILNQRRYTQQKPFTDAVRAFGFTFMRDSDPSIRITARGMLSGIPPSMHPELAKLLNDAGPEIRRDAFALAEGLYTWSDSLHQTLRAIAEDPDRTEEDRVDARRAAASMEGRRVAPSPTIPSND